MKRRITMRGALADPRLLGGVLRGDSWANWRILLIATAGEELNPTEREIFQRFTGRSREPRERIEEGLFLIGRRGGKDRAAAVLATYVAALIDWSSVLSKGERGLVLCIGADQRQAKVQRDYIEGTFDTSSILAGLVVNRTADTIELSNGIVIEVRAASFRRIRGLTCIAVIASETAFWMTEESSNADVEILNAVRPSLATTGGPLIIITTPYARRGVVWNLYRRHFGPDGDPQIVVAQGTSRDFNPTLSQRVVDRAMERDPAAAAAEYLARFRTDIESFISQELLEAAVDRGVVVRPPLARASYYAFADPSGGIHDSFTVGISHREKDDMVVLDTIYERKPPFSPSEVVEEIATLLKSYSLSQITGDKYAAQWVVEAFAKKRIKYLQSERDRSMIYLCCLPLFSSGRARLIDNDRLVSQFAALERHTFPTGKDRVDHGRSGRDDVCNSAAGALVEASLVPAAIDWATVAPALIAQSRANPYRPPPFRERQRFC